ncbi:MAG: cytochrome c oxidase subunit I [Chloroflexota bacterium]|nr:cytochrome c oxidase subunit I [Chloroflexota bacterium]
MTSVAAPLPVPAADAPEVRPTGLLRWVTTVDHKDIGILYLLTSLGFFVLGGVEALLIRVQLAVPRNTFLGPGAYNALFTVHGTTMIFLVVMPILLGFSNYIVPLQIGARDMAFARLNALSYWLFLFGGVILYWGFLNGTPPDTGWFSYAPLSEKPFTLENSVDYWALGLLVTSAGTIATGVNLLVTIVKLRAPGMGWFALPVFSWMSLITAWLILAAVPALTAAQAMLLIDRDLGAHFFDARRGGDPILWQHLFWYFGHPEVYIMALPAFGIISEVVPVFARKPIFGYGVVVGSGIAIAFLSVSVWAHHMFTVGLGDVADAFFGLSSMAIAVPTGVKVFSWLATLWGGRIRLTVPMLFALAFVVQFAVGGLSGVHFATVPVDWQTHDTYYLVAHFHYVLGGGSLFAILAGTYYWFPKITGRLLNEGVGKWTFWLMVIGFNLTFFPMHIVGLMGQPRRTYTYPDLPGWGALNFAETIGAFLMGVAVLLLLWDGLRSLRRGARAGDNPWNAWTLEWATTSPPPAHNFVTLPPITSHRPLWDLQHVGSEDMRRVWSVESGASDAAGAASRVRSQRSDASARWRPAIVGLAAFIFSEITFFGALVVAYLEYRTRSPGPGPHDLDVPRTLFFSVFLFASSGTVYLAEKRLARDDQRGFVTWWLVSIGLGAVFLIGQLTEYMRLYADGITIGANLFTSAFFTLTGFHGLHVLVGLLALGVIGLMARAGDFRRGRRRVGVDAVSIYWHFVDGVWVVIFSLVYLLGLVA